MVRQHVAPEQRSARVSVFLAACSRWVAVRNHPNLPSLPARMSRLRPLPPARPQAALAHPAPAMISTALKG